jgi:hypothetical protein
MDSPLGVIFMSLRIPKIDQESIAKELGYVSLIALDDLGTDPLVVLTTSRTSSGSS